MRVDPERRPYLREDPEEGSFLRGDPEGEGTIFEQRPSGRFFFEGGTLRGDFFVYGP